MNVLVNIEAVSSSRLDFAMRCAFIVMTRGEEETKASLSSVKPSSLRGWRSQTKTASTQKKSVFT